MTDKRNILFECSRNKWRSKTAEDLFKNHSNYNVKSAGTSKSAKQKISIQLINWSDEIYVMEKKHKAVIESKFGRSTKSITNLNIPDLYDIWI